MSLLAVLLLGATVLSALVVELWLFAPRREPSNREAVVWSIGWLSLAVAVAVAIALTGEGAGEWTTVYVIERSLSLDNLFLFLLILSYFGVPPELRAQVVTLGILFALGLRGVAIVAGVALIEAVEIVVYGFGLLLLYVAVRSFRGNAGETDPLRSPILRGLLRVLPVTNGFRGRKLLVREEGRLHATPLLLTVVAIILADIAFAIDSIPAAFAVTRDSVVIWTANAFALLGLRALLSLVNVLVQKFRYLGRTIALILAYVAVKILLAEVVVIGDLASLLIVAGLLAGGVGASLLADRIDPPTPREEETRRPPRCPAELSPPGAIGRS